MKHISNFQKFNESVDTESPVNVRGELIKIIGTGNEKSLDTFMDANNIDANYDSGMLLQLAAKQGKMSIIKYLEEVGGDFSIRRNLAVKKAFSHGQIEAASYILSILSLTKEQVQDIQDYVQSSDGMSASEKSSAMSVLSEYNYE